MLTTRPLFAVAGKSGRVTMNVILVLLFMCAVAAASSELDPCDSNPCLNGATCVYEGDRGFSCQCPLGFKGKLCDELACVGVNQTCERLAMNGDCTTYSESMQRDCRKSCHFCGVCFSVECSVNRVCNERPSSQKGYSCDCPEGMTGQHCNESLCKPPCQNGGVCKKDTLTCTCPPGFNGTTCENCVDEDPNCPQWAAAGQCDSQARARMTFCRHSCHNCPATPCTVKGELCVAGAECTAQQRCQCTDNTLGDGRIVCVKKGDRVCVLHHQAQLRSFGGATAKVELPCRYRLSKLVTALQGTEGEGQRFCSIQVFGFSLVSESARYYPIAADFSLTIITKLASPTIKPKDIIKFVVIRAGIESSKGHSIRWGKDTSESGWNNITFNFVFNKDRFAIVTIPQCGFRLQFRTYDPEEDATRQPQSRMPAIVIATTTPGAKDPESEDKGLHKFPFSLCGPADKNEPDDNLYRAEGEHLELNTVDQVLLYSALEQLVPQESTVKGFTQVALQNPSDCQDAGHFFQNCGNQTKRVDAIKACHGLLSRKRLLPCLGGTQAMESFIDCLALYCSDNAQACHNMQEDFANFRPWPRKRCSDDVDRFLTESCGVRLG